MSSLRDIKITVPTFTTQVPSTKKKVTFRAFNVGDEKALLMAAESKDTRQMISTIKNVLGNCVEGVKVADLAPFDFEYLFIKLRAVSVGETSEIGHACPSCNHQNKVNVDLSDIQVTFPEGHNNIIKLSPDLGFEMRYPDIDEAAQLDASKPESIMQVVAASIKTVYHGDEVITITQDERADLLALLEQLSSTQFKDVQQFFLTMPKMQKDMKYKCHHCGTEVDVHLEGLADFF